MGVPDVAVLSNKGTVKCQTLVYQHSVSGLTADAALPWFPDFSRFENHLCCGNVWNWFYAGNQCFFPLCWWNTLPPPLHSFVRFQYEYQWASTWTGITHHIFMQGNLSLLQCLLHCMLWHGVQTQVDLPEWNIQYMHILSIQTFSWSFIFELNLPFEVVCLLRLYVLLNLFHEESLFYLFILQCCHAARGYGWSEVCTNKKRDMKHPMRCMYFDKKKTPQRFIWYGNNFDMHVNFKSKSTGLQLPCFKSLELSLLESLISIFATPAGVQTSTAGSLFV